MVDAPSHWALQARGLPSPHVRHLDVARALHAALWRSGIACDVVAPGADLSAYRLVVVPAVYLLSDAGGRVAAVVCRGGGHLVVTFCSGIADQSHRDPRWAAIPARSATCSASGSRSSTRCSPRTSRLASASAMAARPGASFDIRQLVVVVRAPVDGAASRGGRRDGRGYASGDLAGLPAVTRHSFGAGTAWYLSTLLVRRRTDRTARLRSSRRPACSAGCAARRFRDPPPLRGRAVVAVRVQPRRRPRLGAGHTGST